MPIRPKNASCPVETTIIRGRLTPGRGNPCLLPAKWRGAVVAALLLTASASTASAQNYSFDARRIALGGAGGTPNPASKLVERQRRYKSVLIPVGLVKVLSNVR